MQGEKENDTTEVTSRDDPNPVGQDSAKNEYGEIGSGSELGGRQSHTEGAGFILQQDDGATEDEDIRPS